MNKTDARRAEIERAMDVLRQHYADRAPLPPLVDNGARAFPLQTTRMLTDEALSFAMLRKLYRWIVAEHSEG